jgi:hypothetical protein
VITATAFPNPAPSAGIVDFALHVANEGSAASMQVLVLYAPPSGVMFLGPLGLCSFVPGGYACGYFDVAPNNGVPGGPDEVDIRLSIQMPAVTSNTTIPNTARVFAENSFGIYDVVSAASVDVVVLAP